MNLTPLSAEGAVRAAERELRRGRRQHILLRLLAVVPPMGAPASGLTQGLARRSQSNEEQQTLRVHQRRPSHHQGVRQDREDGGDQLFVRAQAAAVQAPRPRPHQGDHAAGQLQGTLSGKIRAQQNTVHLE